MVTCEARPGLSSCGLSACTQKRASGLTMALYSISSGIVRIEEAAECCFRSRVAGLKALLTCEGESPLGMMLYVIVGSDSCQ